MTLRQLRYFAAIARARSFRQAAERLHVSQPPLTQAMQALEAELEVVLFERSGRGVRLTAAGSTLLQEAEILFDGLGRLRSRVREAALKDLPRLRVAMTDDYVYSPIATRLLEAQQSGTVSIEITVGFSDALHHQMADGSFDLVLTVGPIETIPHGLVATPLAPSRIMALVPTGHPLATRTHLTPDDFGGQHVIAMPPESPSPLAAHCRDLFATAIPAPVAVHYTDSAVIQQRLVDQGLGIAIVTEHSVVATGRSVRLPIHGAPAQIDHFLLHDRRSSPHATALMASLSDCLDPTTDRPRPPPR